ncbi:MAG TPA: hypothetical protein PLD20_09780 [Blastocatellia bacterium]|nr:hypothetical protein [Blastocatellia bacterium]HMY73417.1 hypothetical protein [Blastocatellia bacterium]HMZ18209.1 hypothetical protein [Blastocatellia bacterium]HNG34288.1 hypothetical protein [Blastocatellia bacterium]
MNKITRRQSLKAGLASLAAFSAAPDAVAVASRPIALPGGLCLNEDNSHYFSSRAGQKLDAETVASWVDQYAKTQVRELMLCTNCMRTSYDSKVWDPIWKGYDPNGADDQPLLASTPAAARAGARNWIHTAWQLHRDGIDPYKLWIERARRHGISPWISMRMNDVHNVDDTRSYIHGEFWREHPQYWRVPYRLGPSADRAFDYGRSEVREHHFKLIRELVERYDFDGLELDWMRFGYHFKPGHEREGLTLLTDFTAEVRRLLNAWEKKRGHRIRLGARVPSRPQTALGLGYDVAAWARRRLIDMLVVTPFWASIETDMPIEVWKELLRGTSVTLAAGLEVLIRTHPESKQFQKNTLETVRGAAASLLDRGADRVYLFNYMDSQTAMADLENYPVLLREAGSTETLAGKSRRHVLTFADTWAPGEPRAVPLPAQCTAGGWRAFRLATGPAPVAGNVRVLLGVEGISEADLAQSEFRVNGETCEFKGAVELKAPQPEAPVFAYSIPPALLQRGYNVIEIAPKRDCRIVWVEISISGNAEH